MSAVSKWSLVPAYDRVLVTGGGTGIGRALALAIADLGCTTYVVGRTRATLEATAERGAGLAGRIEPIQCDLRDAAAVDQALGQIEVDGGPVQALAHCAASVYSSPATAISPEGFERVVASTLIAGFVVIHRVASRLIEAGLTGSIVSLTSATARLGAPGMAHGSAGKAGLEALTKALAREWGPFGLRLNTVGPGAFPVENSAEIWDREEVHAHMQRMIALGRYGTLDEIVGPILFLLSVHGAYVTGETLVVDGGLKLLDWIVEPPHLNVQAEAPSVPTESRAQSRP